MTYAYTYRDKSGAQKQGFVDAGSRSMAFADLKARGITPVGLHECVGKVPHAAGGRRFGFVVPVAIAIALAICGITWWVYRGGNRPASTRQTSRQKRIPSVHPVKGTPAAQFAQVPSSPDVLKPTRDSQASQTVGAESANNVAQSNQGDDAASEKNNPKPVFDNASDQLLAMATSGRPGVPMPPLPIAGRGADMMFMASLDKPIEILDTDSEAVRAVKQRVIDTRAEVKALMEKGLSFQEIMREHQGLVNDNASIRTKAMIEARAILEGGDQEGAETYIRTMNHAFAEMGIEPIRMPGKKYGKYSQGKKKAVEAAKNSKEEQK